ncbi:hypothetical protein L249_4592 [Ophiocordyceps polyrhachis-furcata BCC 54312]|uniref:Uncharacterized protein n=1 Tax=Ophiocordyceps polyrhachis-furcata BCC 54312 TaxID=1330021 RepID=A0A367LC13_9HYPO|nr:hypothetical protein L249_4592 [Ophiocordyceps polyrhachis-furcata BCC 54312]
MASVFIGRETMVRLDEVDASPPSVENHYDRDETVDWEDPLQADSEGSIINRSKSAASDRSKPRKASSQATNSHKDSPQKGKRPTPSFWQDALGS